jgi:hypothetical protein
MSLIEKIEQLDITPRSQEEEYEYTSDFLEWFYQNLYREQGFRQHPVLDSVSKEPEYDMMCQLCYYLINMQCTKHFDTETRVKLYSDMKRWTIAAIRKNEEKY